MVVDERCINNFATSSLFNSLIIKDNSIFRKKEAVVLILLIINLLNKIFSTSLTIFQQVLFFVYFCRNITKV